jgi:hypothetical protein
MRKKAVGLSFAALFLISSFAAVPASAETVEWSEPFPLWEGEEPVYDSSIASNGQGWQVVAWNAWDGYQSVVYANRFNPQIGWSGAEALGTGYWPVAGIDDAGTYTVAWTDQYTVSVTRFVQENDEWDEVIVIPGSEPRIYDLQLSVCGDGGAVAVWQRWDGAVYEMLASTRGDGPTWSEAMVIQESGYLDDSNVAIDDSRNVIVVYAAYEGAERNIYAIHHIDGQGWNEGVLIEDQIGVSWSPTIVMNGDGLAIAGWFSRVYIRTVAFANVYTPELGWGTEHPLEDVTVGSSNSPALAIDENGDAVAAWRTLAPDYSYEWVRASLFSPVSGWSAPTTIDDSTGTWGHIRSCAVTDGGAYVAWQTYDWENYTMRILANHYSPGEAWVGVSNVAESTNITGHAIVPNLLGGVTVAWSALYDSWGIYVSSCSGPGTIPEAPVAVIEVSDVNTNWKTWRFDARASTDDVGVVEYLWDFGDGTYADTKVTCHTYKKAGDYTVTLTVWDEDGNLDSTSVALYVYPRSV